VLVMGWIGPICRSSAGYHRVLFREIIAFGGRRGDDVYFSGYRDDRMPRGLAPDLHDQPVVLHGALTVRHLPQTGA
jgi:hypothetical protein